MQVLSVDLFTWTDDPLLIGGQSDCVSGSDSGWTHGLLKYSQETSLAKMRSIIYWGHSFKLNHIYVISFQLLLNTSKNRFKSKHISTDTDIIKRFLNLSFLLCDFLN